MKKRAMNMSEELKSCPFCGADEIRKHRLAKSFVIQCRCCGAEVMGSTLNSNTTCQMSRVELDTEDKWNQRHDQETIAKQAERIEELESQLNLYPMQPMINGRFEANPIIDWLCTKVSNMNDISRYAQENDIDDKYQEQVAQLVGYSLGGYGSLSYVSDGSYYRADELAKKESK